MDINKRNAIEERTVPAFEFHTLLTREVRPERSWHEFMVKWQAATTVRDMLSLLHYGFDVSPYEWNYGEKKHDGIDRLVFYFTIADGWDDHNSLTLPDDENKKYLFGTDKHGNLSYKSPYEMRQQVAKKAFDMICLNFFKEIVSAENPGQALVFHRDWEKVVISDRLFPVIRNFFRVEKKFDSMRIRNLSFRDDRRSHNESLAVDFLLNLARFIWGWKEDEIDSWLTKEDKQKAKKENARIRSVLEGAKPWMVEVLSGLGRIDLLREWLHEVDKASLDKLQEIAMRNRFKEYHNPVREDRPVATIDEACYLGSKAAWFLKEHELVTREHARLTKIAKEKMRIREAQQKIANLSGK